MKVKYDYLFDKNNNLVHYTEGKKGERYKMYAEDTELAFNFKDYKDRTSHFSLLSNREHFGESPDHYNAKMKIKHELKYFDTIFDKTIYFDKVVAERKDAGRKIPDLQCYQNGELVCFIEIHYTNAKTDEDIENLKINNVPVIEINIKNENKCKHLILPPLLESNREEYQRIKEEFQRIKEECNRRGFRVAGVKEQIQNTKNRIRYTKSEIKKLSSKSV